MRTLLAALALAVAAVAPAFAQTPAPAAAAAPPTTAAPPAYVSPCPRSLLAPKPVIPNGATAKNSDVNKANIAFTAWANGVNRFVDCKNKELTDADAAFKVAQGGNPVLKKVEEYNGVVEATNKGLTDYKASGYPAPAALASAMKKPGAACPAPPAATPAPIPQIPVATAKKKDLKEGQAAFNAWLTPRAVYMKCTETEVNAKLGEANASYAPFKAKREVIVNDYNEVKAIDDEVKTQWDVFAAAYKARMKAAAGGN